MSGKVWNFDPSHFNPNGTAGGKIVGPNGQKMVLNWTEFELIQRVELALSLVEGMSNAELHSLVNSNASLRQIIASGR